jgi:hypothetical protein
MTRLLADGTSAPARPDRESTERPPTIDEVLAAVDGGETSAADALAAEREATKPRSTLLEQLERRVAASERPSGDGPDAGAAPPEGPPSGDVAAQDATGGPSARPRPRPAYQANSGELDGGDA